MSTWRGVPTPAPHTKVKVKVYNSIYSRGHHLYTSTTITIPPPPIRQNNLNKCTSYLVNRGSSSQNGMWIQSCCCWQQLTIQPTAADIKRKNANFAARAQAGKRTTRPARSETRRSVGTWVLMGMGFLVVGGSKSLLNTILDLRRENWLGSGCRVGQDVVLW